MARLTQRIGLPRYEADEHYKLALSAYQKNDYDQAVDHLDKALALLPTNPEYYAARGLVYLEDGILEKAEADFDQALSMFGFEMLALYGLGVVAYKRKKWDDALGCFTKALAAQPERPETLYYTAMTYHRMRQNEQALNYMRRASAQYDKMNDRSHRADANKWVKIFEDIVAESVSGE
ncbi:MAG: tetratricopeptide repeat protein [Anaerolineae bacterium]|nr:tetratricopeptide repeat protein [Anaerolineae bacterium]